MFPSTGGAVFPLFHVSPASVGFQEIALPTPGGAASALMGFEDGTAKRLFIGDLSSCARRIGGVRSGKHVDHFWLSATAVATGW
jgi:hypothetical protein